MRVLTRIRAVPLLLALFLVSIVAAPATGMASAQAPVDLLTTSSFAVLAYSTITNTGTTTITGDAGGNVGVSTTGGISDLGTLTYSGASHLNDSVAIKAETDLVTAYNDAAGRGPVTPILNELGSATLTPGVYAPSSGGLLLSSGTLTLDAQGDQNAVFIIKSNSDLTTMSGTTVSLINGARYCRVFWVVPSSATLGTDSTFAGHLFAMTSIAAQTGAHIQGQLLARTGAVTLDHNTITNGFCATSAFFTITKTARDVNGGRLEAGDAIEWTITVTNKAIVPTTHTVVTDTAPSQTTYVPGSIIGTGADASGAPNLVWNVGTLPVGGQVVLTFRSTVKAGLPAGTVIANQAGVVADYTTLLLSSSSATSPIGNATLIRTGVDDRVWLALAAVLLLAAGAFLVLDRRRRLNA
jgi:uncharacterized repeat protein (TIGR01451 family)